MDLKEKLVRSHSGAPFEKLHNNISHENKKPYKKIIKITSITLASILLSLTILIYVPQIFIVDDVEEAVFEKWNQASLAERQRYISDNPFNDFDKDGVSNSREIELKSGIYSVDTDLDGVIDMFDNAPTVFDETLYEAHTKANIDVGSAFMMNDVLLWADDKESLVKGGVSKTLSGGYHFNNFKGWAKFPQKGIAYKYENGVHTKLKHKEKEDAWYIDGNYNVYCITEEPKMVYSYSFFGKQDYLYGSWGAFVNKILPSQGPISCKSMWLSDTFQSFSKDVTAKYTNFSEKQLIPERFAANNNTMSDLMSIYLSIQEGNAVFASIMDDELGEALVTIYGYTADGNLLISDISGEAHGTLYINPICAKTLEDGIITSREWFEFEGFGFNSKNGQTISLFGVASEITDSTNDEVSNETSENETSDSSADVSDNSSEDTSMDVSGDDEPDVVIKNPVNGTQTIDGKTYYYIDGKKVTNKFVREDEEGNFILTGLPAPGAFYINEDGLKLTGAIEWNGTTILYLDEKFIKSAFVRYHDGEYTISSPGKSNVYYYSIDCVPLKGWFKHNGKDYYASEKTSYVLYNCFVNDAQGRLKYLDNTGQICKNKLIEIDGMEILIDRNGNIINYAEAKDVISKYTRS